MILKEEPNIRVGIVQKDEISFCLKGRFYNNKRIYTGRFVVKTDGRQLLLYRNGKLINNANELLFSPQLLPHNSFMIKDVTIGKQFHWEQKEDQHFRGVLQLILEDEKITVVNIVPLETYIEGVISSEMSASSPPELLKAHAVISRSWLMAQLGNKQRSNISKNEILSDNQIIRWYDSEVHIRYDVCADDHCQRYQGITRITDPNIKNAVTNTRGLFLTYNGKICNTRFSKCCGGMSENYENVWDEKHYPYLVNVFDGVDKPKDYILNLQEEVAAKRWIKKHPSAFCNTRDICILQQILNDYDAPTTNFYRWQIRYSQQEISNLLASKLSIDFGAIKAFIPVKRGVSGRLILLKIVGTKQILTIGKELEIRKIFSPSHLYSSAFIIDASDCKNNIPQQYTIYGAGWGHGVGLCQIGAAVMATKGYTFDKILQHYFVNTALKKRW